MSTLNIFNKEASQNDEAITKVLR